MTDAVLTPAPAPSRKRDIAQATSVAEVMELRKQETRRRVTYGVVMAFCLMSAYSLVWGAPDMRVGALSGVLGLAGPIIGFYFGAKQTE